MTLQAQAGRRDTDPHVLYWRYGERTGLVVGSDQRGDLRGRRFVCRQPGLRERQQLARHVHAFAGNASSRSDRRWRTYNGNPFPATATSTGVDGVTPVDGTFTFTYYAASTATGTASPTAPTNAGTYTVVASFTSGDTNYSNGQSTPLTFTINPLPILIVPSIVSVNENQARSRSRA